MLERRRFPLIRRLVLAPLVVVLAVGILVLFPVLAVVTGVFGLAAWFARHSRMRSLRLLLFAVSWLAAETVALRPANAPDPSAPTAAAS